MRVVLGFSTREGLVPDAHGNFVVLLPTLGLAPGTHQVDVVSAPGDKRATASFRVVARRTEGDGDHERGREQPYEREVELWRRRFAHLGDVPAGMLSSRRRHLRVLRGLDRAGGPVVFDRPITPGCNWTPLGPGPGYDSSDPADRVYSGKVRAIAIDPVATSTVYVGASGGGVWKTTDAGVTWTPKSDYQSSLAIGTLAIDPNNHLHIYAGTGVDPIGILDYYGNGLLISTDGGDSWTESGSATFQRASISRILFDPRDATSKHMLLASDLGIYESADGGVGWTQLYAGTATDLALCVMPDGSLKAIAGVYFQGLYTATLAGGVWSTWTHITDGSFPANIGRVVLGQCAGSPNVVYVGFETNFGGDDLGAIVKTTDRGSTWTSVGKPANPSSQLWHAFHLTVHPTDPNTVFYGEVHLWKTTTGGAPWTDVTSFIHADQNAFAFDPTTPSTVWAGNDGGVYRSTDTGATWAHRNAGLDTFKCIGGAQHPQWDSVFVISSQDTGAYRGNGQPVWELMEFGDTGPIGIDPFTPTRFYAGGYHASIQRSDSAGAPGTFVDKTNGITGQTLFYSPFVLDPSSAGVCYFGADRLWRSGDGGDTWTAATNVLVSSFDPVTGFANALSAIAPHPTDATLVYAVSSDGHVFRIQRTGATWTPAGVTVTDLAASPLPASVSLSSVAVDATDAVWVTVSSILVTEDTGEFTNDHVFRYDPGSGVWASRSTGLAVANPVNAIVVDPASATTLYCGADTGVFRTVDGGTTWTLWDDGLPEVPVFDLVLHQPRRLLRAVTHGRSVWERLLDPAVCPSVDLYLRDDVVDTGRVQPTPSGVQDPFEVAPVQIYWYQSEDVKVDGPDPDYQTPAPIHDFVAFEAILQHKIARRGVVNRFYARVQNRGPLPATNVKVRAFFADAHAGLPPLPPDFWTNGRPFDADPSATDWMPVGPTTVIATVAPCQPAILEWDWSIPLTANEHSCLLVVATCDEDALSGAGLFVVDTLVPMKKQVTLKNLQVEDAVPGLPRPKHDVIAIGLHNVASEPSRYEIAVQWSTVPVGTEIYVAFETVARRPSAVVSTAGDLKEEGIEIIRRGGDLFSDRYPARCGPDVHIDVMRVYRLRRRESEPMARLGVLLPARRTLLMVMNPVLPPATGSGEFRFDVLQRTGGHLVGGSTYLLRVAPSTSATTRAGSEKTPPLDANAVAGERQPRRRRRPS